MTDEKYSVLLVHSNVLQNQPQPHQSLHSSPVSPNLHAKMVSHLLLCADLAGHHLRDGFFVLFVRLPVSSDWKGVSQRPSGALHWRRQNLESKRWLFDCKRRFNSRSSYACDSVAAYVSKTQARISSSIWIGILVSTRWLFWAISILLVPVFSWLAVCERRFWMRPLIQMSRVGCPGFPPSQRY